MTYLCDVCVDTLVAERNGRVRHSRTVTQSVMVCCLCGVHTLLSRLTPAALLGDLLSAYSSTAAYYVDILHF